MAESKSSKSKRSWRPSDEVEISKNRKRKHEDCKEAKVRRDCKTPPLPTNLSSLEELLKQRDNLKEELKKIKKPTKFGLENKNKFDAGDVKRKNIKTSYKTQSTNLSRDNDNRNTKKNSKTKEESPIHDVDYTHLDSEDEESIIEQRRKQRKQLLEKLNFEKEPENCKKTNDSQLENIDIENQLINTVKPSDKPDTAKEVTDMFSDREFVSKNDIVTQDNSNSGQAQLNDNWDDSEGYYNIKIGDIIDNQKYVVKSILGQGVFANVVLAHDIKSNKSEVAIKIMRNNDLIYKTGLKELALLREINEADPENKYHCVKLLRNFMHKGHLCLVLEPLFMDLRQIIKKYGRHGLNMKAVMSYSRQLLMALRLLKKIGIVHADVKPDNILVNEKKNMLKLCDFGSASKVGENETTPYLVSRFYRAPEIILGIPYKHSVDVWSAGCTIYEMATGKIMFTGSSNNKMLKCFMDLKGKIPGKMIRKGKFKDQHFNYNNNFLLHKKDEATGREKFVELSNINATRDLLVELRKSHKDTSPENETKLGQLKDLVDKMLMLDYHQRLSVTDSLKHMFIQEPLTK